MQTNVYDGMIDDDGRAPFKTQCPNGHDASPMYTVDEWKRGLAENTIVFSCVVCETKWRPTLMERDEILEAFARRERQEQ